MKNRILMALFLFLGTTLHAQSLYSSLPQKEAEKVAKSITKRGRFIVTQDPDSIWGGAPMLIVVSTATAEKDPAGKGMRVRVCGTNQKNEPVSGLLDLNEVRVKDFDRAPLIAKKIKLSKFSLYAKKDKRLFFWDDIFLSERALEYLNEAQLFDYIRDNMRNPPNTSRKEVIGRVGIRITVSPIGEIENAVIIDPVSPEQDKEVLRVVKMIPNRWKPAYKEGKYISSDYLLRVPVKAY